MYCCKTLESPYSNKQIIAETTMKIAKSLPLDKPKKTYVIPDHERYLCFRGNNFLSGVD